jgi:CubicO group peptidase (beta-lactamase class C family)
MNAHSRRLVALCILLLGLWSAAATAARNNAGDDAGDDARLAARLDVAIDKALAEKRIVGAVVLVSRYGELVYHRAAGLADREAGTPMREDAIFRLASMSKPLVSVAAMSLVEEGVVSLQDPVTKWLPAFRPKLADGVAPEITIHHLLTHTGGLSYGFEEPVDGPYHAHKVSDGLDQPGLGLEENLARIVKAGLSFAPGTQWRYSLGTDVLGAAIAAAAGKPLPQVVEERVTAPLRLRDTGFSLRDKERLAVAYANATPEPARMLGPTELAFGASAARFDPTRVFDPASYPSGGAGMLGTARDYLSFLEALLKGGGPLLKTETVALMLTDKLERLRPKPGKGWGFGYGWAVLVNPLAANTPQSIGTILWGGAYGTGWFVDFAQGLCVVSLTNTALEGMIGQFRTDVRDAVYGVAK